MSKEDLMHLVTLSTSFDKYISVVTVYQHVGSSGTLVTVESLTGKILVELALC